MSEVSRKKKNGRPCKYGVEAMGPAITVSLPESIRSGVLNEMALTGETRAATIRDLVLEGLAARAGRRLLMATPPAEAHHAEPWTRPHYASTAAIAAAKRGA